MLVKNCKLYNIKVYYTSLKSHKNIDKYNYVLKILSRVGDPCVSSWERKRQKRRFRGKTFEMRGENHR